MKTRQLPLFTNVLTGKTWLLNSLESFQQHLRDEGKTSNTITGFTSDIHLMCEFFGDDMPLGKPTTSDLNRFLSWLENGRGKPCSRKSYARRVTTMKVFFKWLEQTKVRPDNPAAAILQRSGPAPLQPVLSYNDIHALLEYTTSLRVAKKADARPNLLVWLLLDTGIKKSECMNLTLKAIHRKDAQNPSLTVRYKQKRNIYKERRIDLDPGWLAVLDEYVEQYRVKDTLFNCTARNLEYVLTDVGKAAGIEGKVSFEILRWTSAVREYQNGMDLEELREKMGLSRISWRETSQKIAELAKKS